MYWMRSRSQPKFCAQPVLSSRNCNLRFWNNDRTSGIVCACFYSDSLIALNSTTVLWLRGIKSIGIMSASYEQTRVLRWFTAHVFKRCTWCSWTCKACNNQGSSSFCWPNHWVFFRSRSDPLDDADKNVLSRHDQTSLKLSSEITKVSKIWQYLIITTILFRTTPGWEIKSWNDFARRFDMRLSISSSAPFFKWPAKFLAGTCVWNEPQRSQLENPSTFQASKSI